MLDKCVHDLRMERLLAAVEMEALPSSVVAVFHTAVSARSHSPVRFTHPAGSANDVVLSMKNKTILVVIFDESNSPTKWTSIPGSMLVDLTIANEYPDNSGRWQLRGISSVDLLSAMKDVAGTPKHETLLEAESSLKSFMEALK